MRADRRRQLIDAGLAILREEGLRGFTQTRIAARVGLHQGNLTYYFPARTDLLAAVVDAAASTLVRQAESGTGHAGHASHAAARDETTRVLIALVQAADLESAVQGSFRRLMDEVTREIKSDLEKAALPTNQSQIDLLHAIRVGSSVIDLANGKQHRPDRAEEIARLLTAISAGPIAQRIL